MVENSGDNVYLNVVVTLPCEMELSIRDTHHLQHTSKIIVNFRTFQLIFQRNLWRDPE